MQSIRNLTRFTYETSASQNFLIAVGSGPCLNTAMNPREEVSPRAHPSSLRVPQGILACLIAGSFVFIVAGPPVKAGIVAEVLRSVSDNAKLKRAESDLMVVSTCLDMYKLTGGGYPTTEQGLKALVEKPAVAPIPQQWARIMQKMPVDPWGHLYQYRFPGKKDPTKYELFSLGPDGVADTADDVRSDG